MDGVGSGTQFRWSRRRAWAEEWRCVYISRFEAPGAKFEESAWTCLTLSDVQRRCGYVSTYHDCEPLLLFFKSNVSLMVPEDVSALYCQDLCPSPLGRFGHSTGRFRIRTAQILPNISASKHALTHNCSLTYVPHNKYLNTDSSLLPPIFSTGNHQQWNPQRSLSNS